MRMIIIIAMLAFMSFQATAEEAPQFLVLCSCGAPVVVFSSDGDAIPVYEEIFPQDVLEGLTGLCRGKEMKSFTAWDEQRITGKSCGIDI